jgi:hypothetical protein
MRTFEIFDFRTPALKTRPVETVFVDLDDTLICSAPEPLAGSVRIMVPSSGGWVKDPYDVVLRPSARALLEGFRRTSPRVCMLTTATRFYALAMNDAFGFGFVPDDVFARQDYLYRDGFDVRPATLTSHPGSALVDNEHPHAGNASLKRSFLGPGLFVQVPPFDGQGDPPEFVTALDALFDVIRQLVAGQAGSGTFPAILPHAI